MEQKITIFYFSLLVAGLLAVTPVSATILPGYNNIYVSVANDAGAKYNHFTNNTYNIRFEGIERGLNALHISTDPAVNFGQVTTTDIQSGTFYATDSGGKGYEDEIILLVAVNGTIPDDFSIRITSDGYTWTPNPVSNQPPTLDTVIYQPVALDETFTKNDLIYGPQIWKPTGNEADYPIYAGQDMTNTANTFQMMYVDLNAGVLRPNTALVNQGAVRINYSFNNLNSFAAFSVYGYCNKSNNGDDMIAWTNRLMGGSGYSGYSVIGTPVEPLVVFPGKTSLPTDPDNDGIYEDMNGNGIRDFNDLVLFFNQMEWIQANEPVGLFDFNGNGIIDFDDIVRLFREL